MIKKTIAIYCVTYNSYSALQKYLQSVEHSAKEAEGEARVDVFVADNTDMNEEHVEFETRCFQLRVFPFNKNFGYFGAIQKMMNETEPSNYDYVIISNVDLIIGKDALKKLSSNSYDKNIGWIAPRIFSTLENRDRNPKIVNRYSLKKLKVLRLMFRFPLLHKVYTATMYKRKQFRSHAPGSIYAGHGSFIVLTKTFFNLCGNPSYPIFLFGEEIYLAELCRKNGLKVVYDPSVMVEDEEHASTCNIKSSLYYKYNYNALDYLIGTFY